MCLRLLGRLILVGLALLLVTGARAQVTMTGTFVDLFFNETGDLISPLPKDDFPASQGIQFRPMAVGPKKEMIAWRPFPAESWVLNLNGTLIHNGGLEFGLAQNIVVGGDQRRRTFDMDLTDTPGGTLLLHLRQTVSYELNDQRVRFDIELTNLTNNALDGITYLRTVNPKQGVTLPAGLATFETDNRLNSPFFPEGIAVDSIVPTVAIDDPRQRHLALGSWIVGTRVNATGNAFTNLDISLLDDAGYVELAGFDADGNPQFISVPDPNTPFEDGTVGLNLWFDNNVIGTLDPGETQQIGTFFYIFGGRGPVVPEPGALAMLCGAGVSGLFVLLRRRCR